MASQQPAHPYDLLEAKQEVANHVVATRLEKSPPKLMKLEGHTAAITSCSAGPGIIASASEDKVIVQASTSQIDTTNYFAIYAWPMPSRRCCHWADQTCCARISARSSGMQSDADPARQDDNMNALSAGDLTRSSQIPRSWPHPVHPTLDPTGTPPNDHADNPTMVDNGGRGLR